MRESTFNFGSILTSKVIGLAPAVFKLLKYASNFNVVKFLNLFKLFAMSNVPFDWIRLPWTIISTVVSFYDWILETKWEKLLKEVYPSLFVVKSRESSSIYDPRGFKNKSDSPLSPILSIIRLSFNDFRLNLDILSPSILPTFGVLLVELRMRWRYWIDF